MMDAAQDTMPPEQGGDPCPRLRILHSVGHLSRGGIETWLYEVVRRLGPPRYEHHVMVWTRAEEAFTAEFRAAGAIVHALPGHTNPVRFARAFHRVMRSAGPFDVLHTHGTQFHGYVMGLARMHGIPVRIAHSHTDIRPVLRGSGPLYRAYAAAGHRAIRALATAGRGVSELAAISMFGPRWRSDPRWQLLYCGIDLERFARPPEPELREALGIPPGRFVLGHVGRFEPQKNHAFLLDLAAELLRQEMNVHLLMIGDGNLRAPIEAQVQPHGLASRVTFLRDCRDVPRMMANAMDAFILPSLYEGLPLALVEAQAAGLPCLVADAVSAEAVVNPAMVCRLPLAAGVAAWTDALTNLPSRIDPRHPALRALFERSGFSIAHSAERLGALYEASVGEARP
jgi:glycosyltransferase involved in cell wall biosynthesis